LKCDEFSLDFFGVRIWFFFFPFKK
jgi:hypothetical protein